MKTSVKFGDFLPNVRESKTILDSGIHAMDSCPETAIQILCYLVELGFWIPVVGGITNFLSCMFRNPMPRIPDSTS